MIRLLLALAISLLVLSAKAEAPQANCVFNVNHSGCASEIAPISTSAQSSLIAKAREGVLVSFVANNWSTTSPQVVMLFDSNVVPADGTVSPNAWFTAPLAVTPGAGTLIVSYAPGPALHFLNGLVFVCSSTGPFVKTATTNCTFTTQIQ